MANKTSLLTAAFRNEKAFVELCAMLQMQSKVSHPLPGCVTGLSTGASDALMIEAVSEIKALFGTGPLIILPDEHAANRALDLLSSIGLSAAVFPYRDLLFYPIASSHEAEGTRLSTLTAILRGRFDAVITTPDAALQFTIPQARLEEALYTISREDTLDLDALVNRLSALGYVRTDMVEGPGQFARRGGILDVFTPGSDYPYRMELFGDEVDQLGVFDTLTQRKIDEVDYITLAPARELLVTPVQRDTLLETVRALKKACTDEDIRHRLSEEEEALVAGTEPKAIDKFLSLLYPEKECLLDYFPQGIPFLLFDYSSVKNRLDSYFLHRDQETEELLSHKLLPPAYAAFGGEEADFHLFLQSRTGLVINPFLTSSHNLRFAGLFDMQTKQTVSYADNLTLLTEDCRDYLKAGYKTVILCPTEIVVRNLFSLLGEALGITPAIAKPGELPELPITLTVSPSFPGYELTASRFALLSLYSRKAEQSRPLHRRHASKSKQSAKERVMSYADLTVGDYVVHTAYGIGQYKGLETITVDGTTRDFIRIAYAGTDSLFLPATQLDAISKYIGAKADDGTVKLSKMGGADWTKTKTRVKAAAKDMAKELIALYASRERQKGFACAPDGEMQREFDAAFRYEETEGQLKAIDEIKQDMEKARPMDRLLCGDVGFGKTEVAMRAAFKAVENGKQVALLVPTTILALQHFQTLRERLAGFPVKCEMLSRFRTAKQQKEILASLRRGDIDIIVGTHRIVSSDIAFRDLGLVIVDEEQRFGVGAKEKLKQLCAGVDVLTLTATPIPRTLNMSMAGIRDMSILEEAPGDRVPVQTYVMEHDEAILSEAIRKELRRGGQVFYLYNKVETIDVCAARVGRMAGEDARIAIAHGQMDKETLSDIWRGMIAGEFDILVCTTIIESGVDVPNANTLIIENADRFGLSQLHQIRGRVGRSLRRAYAYFTYPRGMVLTEVAEKRLMALREYTEFGAGFKVALRDLEIRGAGNLLGSEQHGHIESVGYELYMRLLNEAILDEKGEESAPKPIECTVDLGRNAYLPESYIASVPQRIDAYKKIALISTEEDLRDRTDELLDRYGAMPAAVRDLLSIAYLRRFAGSLGISKIEGKGHTVRITPQKVEYATWQKVFERHKGRIKMGFGTAPYIAYLTRDLPDPVSAVGKVLKDYAQILAQR